ncbi:MAG: hypothetical protein FJ241_10980 [Nitrospira sp.]|nr:hypothetical protein [Nitrospira sp.]
MPKIPVNKLSKKELTEMANWECPHGHNGIDHYNCWLKYGKIKTKVGYLDIETSNLAADYGIMLSYCIKTEGANEFFGRALKQEEVEKNLDEHLIQDCINDIQKYDTIITFYGARFDIPFIRSRALFWKRDFPFFGQIKHIDAYFVARNKLRIHSNRLVSVCDLLGIQGKTQLKPIYWIKALQGDAKSLEYIKDHNEKDCIILERAYNILRKYSKETKGSI